LVKIKGKGREEVEKNQKLALETTCSKGGQKRSTLKEKVEESCPSLRVTNFQQGTYWRTAFGIRG